MTKAETTKLRGLGRGLNALFEDEESVYPQIGEGSMTPGRQRQTAGTAQLRPGGAQPRRLFDEDALENLAQSIRQHGLLQPILVRAIDQPEDGAAIYEIIAGERRWRAAQKAQLHEVPIVVLDLTDLAALEIALIENLQREDLNPVEEARGYQRLMDQHGHTQEKLAETLGKSRPHIANTVRLLSLPEKVLKYLEDKKLSAGHARALITAKNPQALAEEVIAKGLSVRQTEALAAAESPQNHTRAQKAGKFKDVDTLALEKDLSNMLGMRVTIDSKAGGKKGALKIEYKSLDQLDTVIKRLLFSTGGPSARLMD